VAASRFFSNTAIQTALSGNISSGATAVSVSAVTGFPSLPYTLALDYGGAAEELVNVTAAASTTLTVTRGYGGTSAQSHSIGAVVRHVYDATEAAAFRTHEGATAAIHGVTGTLVGTNDVQTLGNKTLTAPAITAPVITGGASLAGTFTGTPTFSGAVALSGGGSAAGAFTFTGTPSFTAGASVSGGPVTVAQAAAASPTVNHQVTGDANARLLQQADGTLVWGSGAATGDTRLYRNGIGLLQSDNTLKANPTVTTQDALVANLPASSTANLLSLQANAATKAAMDSTGAFQTYAGNAWSTYVPTVTNAGTAVFSRQLGWYQRLGKIVFFEIYLVTTAAGSGTTGVTISLPSTPFRDGAGAGTTRQVWFVHFAGFIGTGNAFQSGPGSAICNAAGTGAVIDRLGDAVDSVLTGQNFGSAAVMTLQGWYREA
jgi:hypothetical protein